MIYEISAFVKMVKGEIDFTYYLDISKSVMKAEDIIHSDSGFLV